MRPMQSEAAPTGAAFSVCAVMAAVHCFTPFRDEVAMILRAICLAATVATFPIAGGHADPEEDARYIADSLYGADVIDVMFRGVGGLMVPMMMGEMQRNGGELSEPASRALTQMMLDALLKRSRIEMTEMYANVYSETLSPEALAAYREFLSTPAGREVAAASARIQADAMMRGEQIGQSLGFAAMEDVILKIESADWPLGTTRAAQEELRSLFVAP